MFISGDYADVILKIKEKELKAHKCVLMVRSPKFYAMLSAQMKEGLENFIEIDDKTLIDGKYLTEYLL